MSVHLETLDETLRSIQAERRTIDLLRELHTQALTEPAYISTDSQPQSAALDRFVALEPDKCSLVYLLLRSIGARNVVEAGTSFGVSTIYLALAVGQNVRAAGGSDSGIVVATENEPTKAARARQHWAAAGEGDALASWIDLKEGDLRETLKHDMPETVDFMLLDIWAPLALPSLLVVKPRLRVGALIVVDNYTAGRAKYQDLAAYLEDPANGFKAMTVPFQGGLHVAVYLG
ncbi:O-methyltransferase [Plectosphaerella plurivora]|uniref:O-methyltransferase n=1 Tax=Plectosphaerella plurivora TaxID=936078 RepID=A0A9P9AEM1_9PEZI|nr:O-methyltransferase [Plectosphaerella plurivora]